ncbi:MAG: hypothetical protein GKR95_25455 [Gammaproteobacteria bacterium]|nr:hypothetical protein [Gammaproteobacteria bacterium]
MERDTQHTLRKIATGIFVIIGMLIVSTARAEWNFDDGSRYGSFKYASQVKGDQFDYGFSGEDRYQVSNTELQYNQRTTDGAWHFANAYHRDEAHFQLGASYKKLRLDAFSGYGKTRARATHRYSEIDPFLFHGGNNQSFEFSGLAASHLVSPQKTVNLLYTRIKSNGLDDREVYGLEFASNNFGVSFMQVNRGEQNAGSAFSVTSQHKKHEFSFDYLEQVNDVSLSQLSYQTHHRGKRYQVSLQAVENPLYEIKTENKIVFSLGFDVGSKNRFYANEEESDEESEKKPGKSTYLFGAIGVGLGVGMSSGSGSSDDSSRATSQHAAARTVLNRINPTSVAINREHGGYIEMLMVAIQALSLSPELTTVFPYPIHFLLLPRVRLPPLVSPS